LLYEGRTLQGARPKLADFCSATMAEFYSAVDKGGRRRRERLKDTIIAVLRERHDSAAWTAVLVEARARLEREEAGMPMRS
ncbi:hypothetical protein, partial [Roseovarius sp. MBR-79]